MSCVTVFGPICLTMGKPVKTTTASGANTHHTHYVSAIQTASGNSAPVTVRVYSPAQDIIQRDNTIVFIIGALNAPAGSLAFIDANQGFIPFLGDPADENYEKSILDMPYLHVFAIGKVLNQADLVDEGTARAFDIAVSEWVQDGVKQFTLNCKIDSKSPRWKRTPAPGVGHFVKVEGFFSHVVKPSKTLGITITHLLFQPGGSSNPTDSPSTRENSPSKRRKFDPAVPSISSPKAQNINQTPNLTLASDASLQQSQESLMDNPPPESSDPPESFMFTNPISSSSGAGPSPKKRGKRKATDLDL